MKLFTILFVSAIAVHQTSSTFSSTKNLIEKKARAADSFVKKVFNPSKPESFEIHIQEQPVGNDCLKEHVVTPSKLPVKGRFYYYPTSYYYPSTYYYYPPSYVAPTVHDTQHQKGLSVQRRASVYPQPNGYNHGYFFYPSGVNNYREVKPVNVQDYYHPVHYPSVPVSIYPPFSKIVRDKSGRPVFSPVHHRRPGWGGFKDGQSTEAPTKGSSTTEHPVTEPIEQQQQEQEQIPDEPTKGFY